MTREVLQFTAALMVATAVVMVDLTTLPYCTKSQVEQFPHFFIPLHSRFGLAFGSGGGGTLALMSFSRSDGGRL